ncbi:hypothetical protein H5T87_07890 [bacterium]|nr:hypothetical protein [bacterium]
MKKVVPLNENWKLTFRSFREDLDPTVEPSDGWFPASVPGDVHLDLLKAGEGPDPFWGLNTDHWRWVEEKDWWYRLDFKPPKISTDEVAHIIFEGIDTFATIFVNGRQALSHKNMFIPCEVDITHEAETGSQVKLAVKIASPIFSVDINSDPDVKTDWNLPRLFARKAQFNYGWDIAPRLVSLGIWRPVWLIIYRRGRIYDFWLYTQEYNDKEAIMKGNVVIEWLRGVPSEAYVKLEIFEGAMDERGEKILEISQQIFPSDYEHNLAFEFPIKNPRLWWPNGLGEPYLYSYRLSLILDDEPIDQWEGNFGIRKVELIQEPLSQGGTSFYFKINNREFFVKGFNWTPLDALPARITDERYREVLQLVKDTNANMLRVWGGGIYEPEVFYDLCDKFGILIWQDFMFACGNYPQTEAFLKEVEKEASYIIRRLRRHPCIALWSGGNENDAFRYWQKGKDYIAHKLSREVLYNVWKKLNPQTPFIPDSPFSPSGDDPNNTTEGDSHRWAHGTSYLSDFYMKDESRFVSEIGHISVPDKEVLLSFIPEDKLWPPFNEYWYFHAADNLRVGWRYRIQSLFNSIRENNLPEPKTLEEFIEVTQDLQAKAYVAWTEHYASLPYCGGILLWNVCDCWPQISDAIIAYPLKPKKAYYAVKEVFKRIKR